MHRVRGIVARIVRISTMDRQCLMGNCPQKMTSSFSLSPNRSCVSAASSAAASFSAADALAAALACSSAAASLCFFPDTFFRR